MNGQAALLIKDGTLVTASDTFQADVAIVGQKHDFLGEVAVAFVIAAPDAPADLADRITRACEASLAGFKCPKAVYLVDEFPRATLEKVAKNRLREIADSYVDGR